MFRKPRLFRDRRQETLSQERKEELDQGGPDLNDLNTTDAERIREIQVEQIKANYQEVLLQAALDIANDREPLIKELAGVVGDTDTAAVLAKLRDQGRLEDLAAGLLVADKHLVDRVLALRTDSDLEEVQDINEAIYLYVYRLLCSTPLEHIAEMGAATNETEPPSDYLAA